MGWAMVAVVVGVGACGSDDNAPVKGGGGSAGTNPSASGTAGSKNEAGTTASLGGAEAVGGDNAGGEPASAGSGGGAVGPRCTISQPFGAPHALAELNTADHEAGARLSSDELTIVFLRQGDSDQVWLAQRKNRADAFGAPQPVLSPNGGVPWISDDALTLWYENGNGIGVLVTQRADLQAVFPTGQRLPTLDNYGDPYIVGGKNGRLYVAPPGQGQVAVSTLKTWLPDVPQPLPGGVNAPKGVRPVVTPDELTLYLCSTPATGSTRKDDIWVQQRRAVTDPFDAPVNVTELNTTPFNFPSWISPDGCRLYFDAGDATRDLYVAERN
jgi:hypothetical protein